MEPLDITFTDGQMHIDGYPDAVKVIALQGVDAQRAGELIAHRGDLLFAVECLDRREKYLVDDPQLDEPLWRSAVAHYIKCFKRSARREKLAIGEILAVESPEATEAHKYFEALRDKHHAHDENNMGIVCVGAILNGAGHHPKLARIVASEVYAVTTDPGTVSTLRQLIECALSWTEVEFEALNTKILNDLEKQPYEALLAQSALQWTVPSPGDIARTKPPAP